MKLAIVGQQDFGKSVLEAFLERGDEVAGVFCAPEKPGARPDALKTAAEAKGVKLFQFASLKSDEAKAAMKSLDACCSSRRRTSSTFRASARSSTTPRCCRSTADRLRSTGPSFAATRRPG